MLNITKRGGYCHRVTKTLAARQHCCAEILAVWLILQKISPNFTLFWRKIPSKFQANLWGKFQKNYAFLSQNFKKKNSFLNWTFSRQNRFVWIFPQKLNLLENFHKNMLCWKSFTTYLHCWNSTNICFVEKFQKKLALFKNFHKKMLCWRIFSNNFFVEKLP